MSISFMYNRCDNSAFIVIANRAYKINTRVFEFLYSHVHTDVFYNELITL